ncbi:MAG: CRISPR-associated protein Cas2 [Treponema sp.]|jgi:CRISPR-associated protein Cas2|nr:CRISPR-associated protein Cas2 [Treponema sp.]MBR4630761.1 CRISPR-associated protein Cas2 [Treponema sp.]MCR5123869.1 CRISPR-associated protein Cas2 [Treponema sp.]
MFVSVVLDPGGMDSAKAMATILARYSFKKIQRACWECMNINEAQLASLKREIDGVTDYYDKLRIYQFPVNTNFAITELLHKKWRRCVLGASPDSQKKT